MSTLPAGAEDDQCDEKPPERGKEAEILNDATDRRQSRNRVIRCMADSSLKFVSSADTGPYHFSGAI